MRYYYCEICGNVIDNVHRHSDTMTCCNHKMKECECNCNEELFNEKHIPSYVLEGDRICVKIGEIMHPQNEDHHIVFIRVNTDKSSYIRHLTINDLPECCFMLNADEKLTSIYAYCNIHGLWVKDVKE